jgi:hypothetical protein
VSGPAVTLAPSGPLNSRISAAPSTPAVAVNAMPARYSRRSALSSQVRRAVTGRSIATV